MSGTRRSSGRTSAADPQSSHPVVADDYADPHSVRAREDHAGARRERLRGGRRHSLPTPVVIDEHGVMGEVENARASADPIRGLDRFDARQLIVARLEDSDRLVKKEPHTYGVRHCYRCDTVVEPRLSDMVRAHANARASRARGVRQGRIRILPEKWVGVYEHWMTNIRDWNICGTWWGHRVPLYCKECDPPQDVIASREISRVSALRLARRAGRGRARTWFSSWLCRCPRSAGRAATTPICAPFYPPTCS